MNHLSYIDFCDKNEDKIFDEIDDKLTEMNLPKNLRIKIADLLYDYGSDILEYRFEQFSSEQLDIAYDRFKEAKF